MIEFFKYYYNNVLKKWWNFLFIIPFIVEKIITLINFYFGLSFKNFENIFQFFNLHIPLLLILPLITLLISNFIVIYKLWIKKEKLVSKDLDTDQKTIQNAAHEFILNKIEKIKPENYNEIKENFLLINNIEKKIPNSDIKTKISINFNLYKKIHDTLHEYFKSRNQNVKTTQEISSFYNLFKKNFNKLKEYNNKIGNNTSISIDEYTILKLIDNINDNLKSLLAYF